MGKGSERLSIWTKMGFLALVGFTLLVTTPPVRADGPPDRTSTITTSYTEYEWWLTDWENNQPACKIFTDHPGQPYPEEVFYQCGYTLYQDWQQTPPCPDSAGEGETCLGFYLHLVNSALREKQVTLTLPPPRAEISIINCPPEKIDHYCSQIPQLLITGNEPLPNQQITSIQGTIGGIPFFCEGDRCEIELFPTGEEGTSLVFWSNSSYGDSSKHYQGKVRLVSSERQSTSLPDGWHTALISENHQDSDLGRCSQIWQAFPPLGASPRWLSNPREAEELASYDDLGYLAGKLITYQLADPGTCPGGGLLDSGYASACGLKSVRPEILQWQNAYNQQIINAAQKTGVPSFLIKKIFRQESQFWPETLEYHYQEFGFGHLTELGADVTLLWNRDFFQDFCPLVLDWHTCQHGYANLDEKTQALLRGTLLAQTQVDRTAMLIGIEPGQAQETIDIFSETLIGNCIQVGKMIENTTEKMPGACCSYQDLWMFTLVNYHAGAGCLSQGLQEAADSDHSLNWDNVSAELAKECPGAVDYVQKITR